MNRKRTFGRPGFSRSGWTATIRAYNGRFWTQKRFVAVEASNPWVAAQRAVRNYYEESLSRAEKYGLEKIELQLTKEGG